MPPPLQQPMNLTGDLSLVGLKLNQLSLARSLHGSLSASPAAGVQLNARGRPDEYLRVSAKLPTAPQPISQEGQAQQGSSLVGQEQDTKATTSSASSSASAAADPVNTPAARTKAAAAGAAASSVPAAAATGAGGVSDGGLVEGVVDGGEASGALHVALRRGQLQGELRVSDNWTLVDVAGMPLDELELASLRGKVETLHAELDFEQSQGSASLAVSKPRFSGLQVG